MRRAPALALVAVLGVATLTLAGAAGGVSLHVGAEPSADGAATATAPRPTRDAPTARPVTAGDGDLDLPRLGHGAPEPATSSLVPPIVSPTTPVGPGVGGTSRARFASRFPAHAAAREVPGRARTTGWAVLIGVNEHQGTTRDNLGSRQDAEALYSHLMDLGWRPDHVLLLTDQLATRETIVEAMHWLAGSTSARSTAVVAYAGHAKQWWGVDVDQDGEVPDEALWPADNDHLTDRAFADLVAAVPAGRLWLNLMACEAGGFLDPGVVADGRIVTYSSAEDEKSYEDPSVGHSVWGWNLLVQGLRQGAADGDGDGRVTVQEAAAFAIPRAATRTARQAHGPQHGGMVDRTGGPFSLVLGS